MPTDATVGVAVQAGGQRRQRQYLSTKPTSQRGERVARQKLRFPLLRKLTN